jgi:hypothetical protein
MLGFNEWGRVQLGKTKKTSHRPVSSKKSTMRRESLRKLADAFLSQMKVVSQSRYCVERPKRITHFITTQFRGLPTPGASNSPCSLTD